MSKKKIFANCTGIPSLFLQECVGTLLCWALEAVGWVDRPYAKRQEAPLCKTLVALMPSFVHVYCPELRQQAAELHCFRHCFSQWGAERGISQFHGMSRES